MAMYSLIEYKGNYSKTSGNYSNTVNNVAIVDFNLANFSDSPNFKEKITGQTGDDGTKDVEIMVPLKYNFWRFLEMHLINCEINLILTCPAN